MKGLGWMSLAWLNAVLTLVVFTLFAVTCHRIVLLGETSVPEHGLLSWTSRETRFLGWLLVSFLYFAMVFAPMVIAVVAAGFTGVSFIKGYEKYWALPAVAPAMYVLTRLSVLLPATAIGERRNTDWAFETTAGNGWRLLIATSLIPVTFGLVADALPLDHSLFRDFVVELVDSAFMAVGIVALSLSFRFLSSVNLDADAVTRSQLEAH